MGVRRSYRVLTLVASLLLIWTVTTCAGLRRVEGRNTIQRGARSSGDDAGAGILYSLLQAAEATAQPSGSHQSNTNDQEYRHGHSEGDNNDEDYYLYSNEDAGVSAAPSPAFSDHDMSDDYAQNLGGDELTSQEEEHHAPNSGSPHQSSQSEHEQSNGNGGPVQSQEPIALGRPITVADRPHPPRPRPTLTIPRPQRPQRPQPPPVPSPPTPRRLPPVRAPIFLPRPLPTTRALTPPKPSPAPPVTNVGHMADDAHELDSHVAAHGLEDMESIEKSVVQESHEVVGAEPATSVHHGTNIMSSEKPGSVSKRHQNPLPNPTLAPEQRHRSVMTSQTNSVMDDDMADLSPQPTSLDIVTERTATEATHNKELVLLGESVMMSKSTEEGSFPPLEHGDSGEEFSEEDGNPHELVTSISVATAISEDGDKRRVVEEVKTSLSVSQSVSTNFNSKASIAQTSAEDMTESTVDSSAEVTYGMGTEQNVKPEIVSSEKMGPVDNLRVRGTSVTKAESVVVSHNGHVPNGNTNPTQSPTTPRETSIPDVTSTSNPLNMQQKFSNEPQSIIRTTINVSVSSSESVHDGSHFPTEPTTTETTPSVSMSSTPTPTVATTTTVPTTTTTAKSVKTFYDKKTGRNITLQIPTESADILSKFLPPGLTTTPPPQTETPIGKSLKTIIDKPSGRNISLAAATEDPSILAKLLPPSFTTAKPSLPASVPPTASRPSSTNNGRVVQTFFNKATGKNMSIALLTEDPSILAAITPPTASLPPKNDPPANVRVIYDKKTGRNITIQLATEDPNILAMMTPPPRPGSATSGTASEGVTETSINTTTASSTIETTTPPVVYHQGVQQSGKVHIITRHNVTRKPFLVLRATTKNPRPPPTFRKISDILNRNMTANTRKPKYQVRQQYEGSYPNDPDKRSTTEPPIDITTIRTTTTLSPYFRWGPHVSVASSMKVVDGMDWSEALRDSKSLEFKQASNEVEGELDRFYRSSSVKEKYKGVQVDGFSRGSVIVDYTLYLKDDVRGTIEDTLKESYRTSIGNDTRVGKYKVDPLYVSYRVNLLQSYIAPPESTDTESTLPHWAIAIAGVGAASTIFIIVLCLIMHFAKRATRRKYGAPLTDDIQQERKASVAATTDKYAYDNNGAEGLYDMGGDVWNEKKQRPRNGSSSGYGSHRGYQSRSQLYSTNPYEGNPYAGSASYQKTAYEADGAVPAAHTPPKYYDAWNEWDDVYTSKKGSLRARDYDTTF